ncbi:GtrA family protein [Acidisoma cellulosilytica]|uniref:GtrA family protein n=1 Tax=Acidisoma cellulosilyticum TaxID=2802395 RepID=A0A964E5B2_9PROT|nr:GtrA family protein [Acidisoma cellulosilyticum]MCB8881793.1 GtrA family protein [Acidisoma cellulosilyticum]
MTEKDGNLPEATTLPNPPATPKSGLAGLVERHGKLVRQFFQFGVVGTFGFLVDNAFVYTAHFVFGIGLILAGILSFFVAATANWFLNRIWTFRGASTGRVHHEWLRYLASNALGFVLNRGVYIALIATSALCVKHPVIALAAGSIAGLGINFVMSRRVVFK